MLIRYKHTLDLSKALKISSLFCACCTMLFKLLKFDFTCKELDETYNFLQGYNLFAFQHRVVLRLSLFAHKIINVKQAPFNLKNQIIYKSNRKKELRETTKTTLFLPMIKITMFNLLLNIL